MARSDLTLPIPPAERGSYYGLVGVADGHFRASDEGVLTIRSAAVAAILIWLTASAPTPVGACDCSVSTAAPCVAAWEVDAVFVAELVDATPDEIRTRVGSVVQGWGVSRNRMRVSESFRGNVGPEIEVVTDSSSTCAFGFDRGEVYLVYARRGEDGSLTTGRCSRTHKVRDRGDLEYLRAAVQRPMPSHGSIVGKAAVARLGVPLAGIQVIAESGAERYETRTAGDGSYELPVPPGSYRVRYAVGDGLYSSEALVQVVHEGSCVAPETYVRPDGRIIGRVVDTNGVAVSGISVFLAYFEAGRVTSGSEFHAVTDEQGVYRLGRLDPGTLFLGLGTGSYDLSDARRVFFPGVTDRTLASTLALELGERRALADLVIPADVPLLMLTGTVRAQSGDVVPGATVTLLQSYLPRYSTGPSTRQAAQPTTADEEGRFSIAALAGSYSLAASLAMPNQTSARIVRMDLTEEAGRADVTLTLPD